MSLAFPEFATSAAPSPFLRDFEPKEPTASELLSRLRLSLPLPFNPPGRYFWGQVQDEGALLTSLSSLRRKL